MIFQQIKIETNVMSRVMFTWKSISSIILIIQGHLSSGQKAQVQICENMF